MDTKLVFALAATAINTITFLPYIRDMVYGTTRPHTYTFLIWMITQGTAVVGLWYGGGGLGALNLTVGLLFIFGVFLFSLFHGTKNITRSDTIVLVGALAAIGVWWQLHNPVLSVIMVTVIDVLGYIPTYRKTFESPRSETAISWAGAAIGNVLALGALSSYNFMTMSYLIVLSLANIIVALICIIRRPLYSKPQ
ncbi:MAG: hypothetical protein AAB400_01855 [Patescibacteria group bacterium]